MGNGAATLGGGRKDMPMAEVVAMMMPVYYTHDAKITNEILETAKQSWLMIVEDRSPAFLKMKKDPSFEMASGISWFYTMFYERLFDVHPMSKPLFKNGMVSQGKFLVKMITLTINSLKYPEKFKKTMEDLAMRHCERGVKAGEYAIVGDVLFWVLERSLGPAYTVEVEDAWKKIYSAMIQIIIPLCVEYERSGIVERDEGADRHTLRSNSFRQQEHFKMSASAKGDALKATEENCNDNTVTETTNSATSNTT